MGQHAELQPNPGGGFAVRYVPDDPKLDPLVMVRDVAASIVAAAKKYSLELPEITIEPGRSIVAPAGVAVYRVGSVKKGSRTYVAVDGGMSDNPRPVLYGAGYEAYLPARIDEPRPLVCSIAGKHCEQGDIVVRDAQLPSDLAVGEVLATPVTGAYGLSLASNYNKVTRPAVVFVRDGSARLVVRRETDSDLVRLDADA